MSRVNGDKSRFNRKRKQNIARRIRGRKLLQSLTEGHKPAGKASNSKPKALSA